MVKKISLEISGMHCSACAMDIDGILEDTEGVVESSTSYAREQTEVTFDPEKITEKDVVKLIKNVGYQAKPA